VPPKSKRIPRLKLAFFSTSWCYLTPTTSIKICVALKKNRRIFPTRLGDLAPVATEALAALEAFQFCHSVGRGEVVFVGDAKQVVDAVLSGSLEL
jgi:hypothetical protein